MKILEYVNESEIDDLPSLFECSLLIRTVTDTMKSGKNDGKNNGKNLSDELSETRKYVVSR